MSMNIVTFDPERLARFRAAYEDAVLRQVPIFNFDNHDFYVGYAKYLIELEHNTAAAKVEAPADEKFADAEPFDAVADAVWAPEPDEAAEW